MKRNIAIAAGVAAIALTGTVIAVRAGGAGPPQGVSAGITQATNNVTACSSIGGGGGLCNVSVNGSYFDVGLLGNGKYTGTLTIDWSTYAVNPNNNNEMCANITGKMTFTTGSSVLKAKLFVAPSFGGSFICEAGSSSPPFIYNRDLNLGMQMVSGTGKFKKLVPASSQVYYGGQSSNEMNATQTGPIGTYLDQGGFGTNFG
jgi:hypothetical protein